MIVLPSVLPDGDRLRLVTQPDHAAFAADLLSLFRLPALAEHPRRADLLRAVRLHDNGWRELDAAPPVDPASGLPHTFLDLPRPLRLEVWERGTARYVDSDPYAALLATEHALTLFAGEAATDGWRELLARLAERRGELLARYGLAARLGEERLALSPFPLAGATTFAVPCRWVDVRRYAGDGELAVAIAGARWTSFPIRVAPAM